MTTVTPGGRGAKHQLHERAESVDCPTCGVQPAKPCLTNRGSVCLFPHSARIGAANRAAQAQATRTEAGDG
jgi:hypothetical protein